LQAARSVITSHQVGYRTVNKIGFEVYRNVSVSVMSVSLKKSVS